jgi:hypothetical protein
MKISLRPQSILVVILLSFILAYWIGLFVIDRSITHGHVVWGDGMYYYEYLPSMIIDGDLDFRNQREWMLSQGIIYPWSGILEETATGHVGTPFAVGWAILTAPFFLLAHAIVTIFALPVDHPGYGFVYESITNFGSVLGGLIGVLFTFRLLRLFFDAQVALISTVAFLLCSNLPYYIVVQASQSHSLGFFTVATASYYIVKAGRSELAFSKAVVLSGLFLGLAFLTRPQLLLAAICLYAYLATSRNGIMKCTVSGLVALPIALIQLYVWYVLYGTPILIPQGPGFLQWTNPNIMGLLFSLHHGLFSWHPVTMFAVLGFGLVLSLPREKEQANFLLVCLVGFVFQVYINAAASDWWAGNSFGSRRFIDTYTFLIFPLALLVDKVNKQRICWIIIILLAIWNALFFIQYRFCYIPRGETITPHQMFIDKFMLFTLDRPYCASK